MQKKFFLNENNSKDLIIRFGLFFRNIQIFYKDNKIGSFANLAEAKVGKDFRLPDGSDIFIQKSRANFSIKKEGKEIEDSIFSPEQQKSRRSSYTKAIISITIVQLILGLLIAFNLIPVSSPGINLYMIFLIPIAVSCLFIWAIKSANVFLPGFLILILQAFYIRDDTILFNDYNLSQLFTHIIPTAILIGLIFIYHNLRPKP